MFDISFYNSIVKKVGWKNVIVLVCIMFCWSIFLHGSGYTQGKMVKLGVQRFDRAKQQNQNWIQVQREFVLWKTGSHAAPSVTLRENNYFPVIAATFSDIYVLMLLSASH